MRKSDFSDLTKIRKCTVNLSCELNFGSVHCYVLECRIETPCNHLIKLPLKSFDLKYVLCLQGKAYMNH